MAEPESLVIHMLQEMRKEFRDLRDDVADVRSGLAEVRSEMAEVRSELKSLRADVAADFLTVERRMDEREKRTSEQIVGLRRAVVEYHTAVVGQGVLLTEFEDRVRKLEKAP